MNIVSYGGGTDSTAMIVHLHETGVRPDHIVFADTGGEKPYTYDYLKIMRDWCSDVGFPDIITVVGSQPKQIIDGTLENSCLRLKTLPPKAFGFGTCSEKWKINPFNKWAKTQRLGDMPIKMIGFDFDEPDRAEKAQEEKGWNKIFPLMECFWGRAECKEAIKRAGLPQPGKSACFFCPSSKKNEILQLREEYPELMTRALRMEKIGIANKVKSVKGLGRSFSWAKLLLAHDSQMSLFDFMPEPQDCGCFDG